MVIEPYGYAIWENIQREMDTRFKKLGVQNVYMPLLIPESLLQKEKDHVEGFAPECAVVTEGGGEKLAEKLFIRPTSEVLFCEHYQKVIHSYRDLPKLYNQWCSVLRWEKTTRPFLRGMEFLWQEGHTMHETAEEAEEFTLKMLHVYDEVYRDVLAIPPVIGKKTEKEKFAGAEATYTLEPMMHNGVALQGGTSHYFGDGFTKAFDITFTGRDNGLHHPYQTSWGMSTRLIGAVIMVHGDDSGLVLPPKIAPIQVAIVPVAQHKPGVLEKAQELRDRLSEKYRVKLDDSDNSPGWKFAQYEMQGHGAEPVRPGAPGHPGEAVRLLRPAGGRCGAGPLQPARRHVPAGPAELEGEDLHRHHLRGLPGHRPEPPRLYQGHVVRRQRLRGQDQGGDRRRQVPVHPLRGRAALRRVRLLRQARQAHGLLGQAVLIESAYTGKPLPRGRGFLALLWEKRAFLKIIYGISRKNTFTFSIVCTRM